MSMLVFVHLYIRNGGYMDEWIRCWLRYRMYVCMIACVKLYVVLCYSDGLPYLKIPQNAVGNTHAAVLKT